MSVLHLITGKSEKDKLQLVETLRTQYFVELNDLFEFEVFDFDAEGNDYRFQNSLDLSALNSLYNSDGTLQITSHFAQITERRMRGSYVGRFPVYNDSQFAALYFTLLTPKSKENKGQLSDQIRPSEVEKIRNEYSFSFAVNAVVSIKPDFDPVIFIAFQLIIKNLNIHFKVHLVTRMDL